MRFLGLRDTPFLRNVGSGTPVTLSEDDMESYSDAADLNGLNGGTGWAGAYVSNSYPYPQDDIESYSDTADLNGLNGGSDWAGAYVSR
jgi:hypothetical protein